MSCHLSFHLVIEFESKYDIGLLLIRNLNLLADKKIMALNLPITRLLRNTYRTAFVRSIKRHSLGDFYATQLLQFKIGILIKFVQQVIY